MMLQLLAGLLAASSLMAPPRSGPIPVPAGDYPRQTVLEYFPSMTNRQFDCVFGWDCDAHVPYFHLSTEDQLHRVRGWGIWGHWHDDVMGFELYSSVYVQPTTRDAPSWNQVAAQDELVALGLWRHVTAARTIPMVLPDGVRGQAFARSINLPGWHVFLLTAWWGSDREVEGAVLYPPARKGEARRDLIRQVRIAVSQVLARDPTDAPTR